MHQIRLEPSGLQGQENRARDHSHQYHYRVREEVAECDYPSDLRPQGAHPLSAEEHPIQVQIGHHQEIINLSWEGGHDTGQRHDQRRPQRRGVGPLEIHRQESY